MNTNPKYTGWVEHLGWGALPQVLFLRLRLAVKDWRFRTADSSVQKILKILGITAEPVLIKEKDTPMQPVVEKIKALSAGSFRPHLARILKITGANIKEDEKFELYFTQELAADLKPKAMLLAALPPAESGPAADNIVLVSATPWIRELRQIYPVWKIVTYWDCGSFNIIVLSILRPILEWVMNASLILVGKRRKAPGSDLPTVAILHTHGTDPKRKSDAFWFPGSGINPKQILLFLLHHNRGPGKDTLAQIKEQGIGCADILPWRLSLRPWVPFSFELYRFPTRLYCWNLAELIKTNFKILGGVLKSGKLFWFWAKWTRLADDLCLFEAFFQQYHVKAHFSAFEAGRHMAAANLAVGRAKGIDICHHWSNYDWTDVHLGKPHDAYLTWGPYFKKNFFNEPYYLTPTFVYTGYPYGHLYDFYRPAGRHYRQELRDKGARFIIAFFDQSAMRFKALWNEEQERLYALLLEWVMQDKELGLVFKPKKVSGPLGLRQKFPKVWSLAEQALKTGRLIVLDGKSFPAEASLAADVVIGMGASSTPCLEAALAGIPAVTYNAEKNMAHPMVAYGHNKIIFTDLGELKDAVQRLRKKGDSAVGNYEFILNDIDPFRDGMARNRIAAYVKAVLDGFHRGEYPESIIRQANESYRRQFGRDKVESRLQAENEKVVPVEVR